MKFQWNNKYFTIAIYALAVLLILALVVFVFVGLDSVASVFKTIGGAFTAIIYGAVIAFLVNPIMKWFSNIFAFVTADDKIPEDKPIQEIPDLPAKPVRPESIKNRIAKIPNTKDLDYYQKIHDTKDEYYIEINEYNRLNHEYNRKIQEIEMIKRRNKSIEKNRERTLKRIIRVTSRHNRIHSYKYTSGNPDIKTRYALRRALAVICSSLTVVGAVAVFTVSVLPSIISGIDILSQKLPGYVISLMVWVRSLPERLNLEGDYVNKIVEALDSLINSMYGLLNDIIPLIRSTLGSIFVTVKDLIIGIFFGIYFLFAKERVLAKMKKLASAILPERAHKSFFKVCSDLNTSFGSFITAKLLDSLIIGLITLVLCAGFGVPYATLIALIVGVTNVIPMFGPFIGAIPSAFIILAVEPSKTLTFIILILLIQQFDGNVLGPRLLGAQVKSTSLGILTAITIFSAFWGLTGLVIAVPVFSVLYEIIKNISENILAKKGLKTDTIDYYNDEIGLSMCEEIRIKEAHRTSFTQALESTKLGRIALKSIPVAALSGKVDEIEKNKAIAASQEEDIKEETESEVSETKTE